LESRSVRREKIPGKDLMGNREYMIFVVAILGLVLRGRPACVYKPKREKT
jgi:hypothetical protein